VRGVTLSLLGSRDLFNSTRGYYETKEELFTVHDGKNGYASRGTTGQWKTWSRHGSIHKDLWRTSGHGAGALQLRLDNYQNYYRQNWTSPPTPSLITTWVRVRHWPEASSRKTPNRRRQADRLFRHVLNYSEPEQVYAMAASGGKVLPIRGRS